MIKSDLRKNYLDRQKKLSPFERMRKSEQIADRFFREFDLDNVRFLQCFVAIEKFNEIDTSLIFKYIWQNFPQIETLVPRVDFENEKVENLKFDAETKLRKNIWQIFEPTTGETIKTEKIDMILVPLLCFDENGFRVGHGKGFYDKLLTKCRNDCLKIGLSYFPPVNKISDLKDYDIKLDFCITPEKKWKLSSEKIERTNIKL